MEILRVDGVSLTYQTTDGETEAVKNVSFGVETGEFISLVGPSGCGKTTILSLIAGLIPPTDGRITILGKNAASSRRSCPEECGKESLLFVLLRSVPSFYS